MDKSFLLMVFGPDVKPDYGLVSISAERARYLLTLMDEAHQAKQADEAFYALVLFDYSVKYYERRQGNKAIVAKVWDCNEGFLEITADERATIPIGDKWSTTAETIVITTDEVRWEACDKYSSLEYDTAAIPRDVLEEIALIPEQA